MTQKDANSESDSILVARAQCDRAAFAPLYELLTY